MWTPKPHQKQVTHCATWNEDKNGKPYPKPLSKKRTDKLAWADQSFKEQSNVNNIIDKARQTGTLAHITEHANFYADMTEFNYEEARQKIAEANSVFYELDAELRSEFNNDPGYFANWCAKRTPEQILEKLPQLAKPGRQFPDVAGITTKADAPKDKHGSPKKESGAEEKPTETKAKEPEPAPTT